MSHSIAMEEQPENFTFDEEFESTVDGILQSCPGFRILVLERSGVGKSHSINAVFGTGFTVVQHGRTPGVSNINDEVISQKHPRLILHDSQGFSHGDPGNFETVKRFIEERSKMPELKDILHAIWLCTEIPTFGSALLESSEKEIIDLKDSIRVPIIAVLTNNCQLVRSR
ncbi:hypothetical protein BT96DRAFT_923284 [Gymnopus androsaceus JB14]|uniref:G domain-containing protein n=1 Tax=Gymnopus androsaceus JB14 TaxID=1447944 RepID=A0A6A4HAH4_9AGAR|nr:hypothetical protein BT96DRAFT_923284 [Gymnopus androsaceus JB14]